MLVLAAVLAGPWGLAQEDYAAGIDKLVRSQGPAEALPVAAEWVENAPDDPDALMTHGALALRCGAYQEAVDSYESAQFFADTAQVATCLGDALLELGRANLALAAYRHALELDDAYAPAHVGTGRALLAAEGDGTAARLCLQSALAIDPENAQAKVALAEVDIAEWRLSDARLALRAVTQSHPDAALAWLLLGRLSSEAGDAAGARDAWRRYVKLEPARPETWLLGHNMLPTRPRVIPLRGSYFVYSPDGTKVAYIGAGAEANQQVLVTDPEGNSEPQTVCQLPGRGGGLAWSPDGSRLVVRTYDRVEQDGKRVWQYTLTTTSLDGRDQRTVIRDLYLGMPVFMPDGKRLCFDAPMPRQGRLVVVCDDRPDAVTQRLASCPPGTFAQWLNWSRDGSVLVASTHGYTPVRHYDLVAFRAKQMASPVTLYSTPDAIYYPTLTADGQTVVFLQVDDQSGPALYCVGTKAREHRTCLMLKDMLAAAPPSMSPDGKKLLTYRSSGLTVHSLVGLREG